MMDGEGGGRGGARAAGGVGGLHWGMWVDWGAGRLQQWPMKVGAWPQVSRASYSL